MFFLSDNQSNLKNLLSFCRFLLSTVFVAGLVFELAGCGGRPVWKNHGESCILVSETPPLKRVINYTDHELCERKLSPRKAPNPQTRPDNLKD
tara:strand:+ start:129 stop:407 length:279 start_codon:yes stop_codon:yes gene_type:complete